MASCSRRKSILDDRSDLISQLPVEVKDRILEHLPTRDAARIALLSTHWRDVWLSHGRLVFDHVFFRFLQNFKGDKCIAAVNRINDILLLHVGPIQKFTLRVSDTDFELQQPDLDKWCVFLSRNGVEKLEISISSQDRYKLPVCIVFCPTIKQLELNGFFFGCPVNFGCIFPRVTSLAFANVEFERNDNGIVSSIPNLENLDLTLCDGINNFAIHAPKLTSLHAFHFTNEAEAEWRWLAVHWETIKTLCLAVDFLQLARALVAAPMAFPIAKNLQVIRLDDLSFASREQLTFVKLLLQKSPNLWKLEIMAIEDEVDVECVEAASRLFEDPNGCFINQDMEMLKTVKIDLFRGSRPEILFVKELLLKSPALEEVVIHVSPDVDVYMAFKITRKLLRFPRASQKAQLVFMEDYDTCLFDYSE